MTAALVVIVVVAFVLAAVCVLVEANRELQVDVDLVLGEPGGGAR
ncbi:hypothetical protein [Nocardioides lijunqiniae]|nr:hypothetical protein [Nocardioides lijunqiniae]